MQISTFKPNINLDHRSLALFRILVGLNLLYDVLWKCYWIPNFVGVTGMFDVQFLKEDIFFTHPLFTIIQYFPTQELVYAFLGISIMVFFLYTIGYKTKILSILSLFFYLNICEANLFLVTGYQTILVALLVWSIFLPLDSKFAVTKHANSRIDKIAAFGLIIQICCIYFFNAYNKTGDAWLQGYAVELVLMSVAYQKPLAQYLLAYPSLCQLLNYATLVFEYLLPLLILSPFYKSWTRFIAAVAIVAFHWGLFLFIDVGNFHLVALATASVLLPASFWEYFKVAKPETQKNKAITGLQIPTSVVTLVKRMVIALLLFGVLLCSFNASKQARPYLANIFKHEILKSVVDFYLLGLKMPIFFKQEWTLFAPSPMPQIGYLKLAGQTADYEWYNLKTGTLLTKEENKKSIFNVWHTFQAWYLVFIYNTQQKHRNIAEKLGKRWVLQEVNQWNTQHPDKYIPYAGIYLYSIEYTPELKDKQEPNVIKIWEDFVDDSYKPTENN